MKWMTFTGYRNWFMHSQVSTTRRQLFLTILRQIQTPQEVIVWFGCGQKKKKGKFLWFGKQTIWFVTCVGKKPFLTGILYGQGSNLDSGN